MGTHRDGRFELGGMITFHAPQAEAWVLESKSTPSWLKLIQSWRIFRLDNANKIDLVLCSCCIL